MVETSQPPSTDDEFQIFSSIRYDPDLENCEANDHFNYPPGSSSPFYMLRYHRDRMLNAAQHFGLERASATLEDDRGLESLTQLLRQSLSKRSGPDRCLGPLKVRSHSHHSLIAGAETIDPATHPHLPLRQNHHRTISHPSSPTKQPLPNIPRRTCDQHHPALAHHPR